MEQRLTNVYEKTLAGEDNIHYLDCGDGWLHGYNMCDVKISNCTFYICKVYCV